MGITVSRNGCQLGLEGHSAKCEEEVLLLEQKDFRAPCKIEMDRARLKLHPFALGQPEVQQHE